MITAERYAALRDEELAKLGGREAERYSAATDILDALVLTEEFPQFLTLIAYPYLDQA